MPMLTRAGRRRRQRAAATPATHQQHVLELSPVTAAVVRTMSLRGLIGIRGVSRAFRDAATQRLQTMERPVVGGGLPCEESCHTLETLNLATMEWELTPALCACRSEAACADIREEGGGWRLVLAGGDTLAESDSAELRGWSVTKVGPTKLRLNNHVGQRKKERCVRHAGCLQLRPRAPQVGLVDAPDAHREDRRPPRQADMRPAPRNRYRTMPALTHTL
eukprot:COSAG04_NODE_792_length_10282_cov_32.235883_4_plen_220_part_00